MVYLKGKIRQTKARETEAAKRPFSHGQLKQFTRPTGRSGVFISQPGQPKSRSPRPRSRLSGMAWFSWARSRSAGPARSYGPLMKRPSVRVRGSELSYLGIVLPKEARG